MIRFFNIRSKEVRVAETEPQIAALWSSSDHSPNITQGQDFGWRLAPEVVVEMKRIKQDPEIIEKIAKRISKNTDEITEPDILHYISATNRAAQDAVAKDEDYSDEYNEEIRRLEILPEKSDDEAPAAAPQESLADLEKRVELEERLAAAREKNAAHDAADAAKKTEQPETPPADPKKTTPSNDKK